MSMKSRQKFTLIKSTCLLITLALALFMNGCAGVVPMTPEEKFVAQVDAFVAELLAQQPAGVDSLAPASVMPASLIRGGVYTRLEEYVVDRLSMHLRQSREIYTPSRENWFELRERQPFTFAGQPDAKRSYLDSLVVYQVAVTSDEVLKQVTVQATAVDATGKPIPGVLAESSFPRSEAAGPAMLQYQAKPKSSPIPEGLEERPFVSMDRLTYSLASEMASAYRANLSGNANAPTDAEIKVVLQTRSINHSASDDFLRQLESSLQQAFVSKKGFACAVSQKDFVPTFNQIDFYRKNRELFEMDETLLSPGSVVLLAEAFPHKDTGKVGINLRSLWRITPLENNQGQVMANNPGGTYLSGFVAKAYLEGDAKSLAIGGVSLGSVDIRSSKDKQVYQPGGAKGFD
jgi:hypothetical protein